MRTAGGSRKFLSHEARGPFVYAVGEVRAGRIAGGAAGVRAWLGRPEVRDHFMRSLGVGSALDSLQREAARKALLTVFDPEVREFPDLASYLSEESQLPFRHALMDLQAGRNGG